MAVLTRLTSGQNMQKPARKQGRFAYVRAFGVLRVSMFYLTNIPATEFSSRKIRVRSIETKSFYKIYRAAMA